ncbi:MAG: 16S rRNA (cytosine(1402)-N(4))-methyltransferase RsmH [Phycisphaeraceae bacterium]|nr:16S rRNA (cytosine(1402)-N(4))-methyltransferase RsmH [Phycisphaeraceae bacterium]MCW5762338.1 16S rRNA (cytosine(1402)-N(4))-methyltransferase RsmH [Phycisphaeraceae bacterium]
MSESLTHTPVLLSEVLEVLDPQPGETLVDCTAGLGGHAAAVAARVGPSGQVVLLDLDPGNLARAEAAVRAALTPAEPWRARVIAIQANFASVGRELVGRGLRADMLLADLGFASTQMDDAARGFSFRRAGPLDMRLDPAGPIRAAELVNTLPERELADLIYRFGEDRLSRRIARAIVEARAHSPIETTDRLAEVVARAYPVQARHGPIHPATRTFQALRIAVNDELGNLEALLAAIAREAGRAGAPGQGWLNSGSRVALISFHSLEDRPIKIALREIADRGFGQILTRRPISASEDEVSRNTRARSAKLRSLKLTKSLPDS